MKYCAALALMLIAACAMGGAQKTAVAPASEQRPQTMPVADRRAELDSLYAQIEEDRSQLGIEEPGYDAGTPLPMGDMPRMQTDNTCRPAQSETCTSSCKLSDSICKNAERICELANDLKPDEQAAAKCVKAEKTCKTAHDKCCGCQL